jgi:AsmA protein
MKKHPLVSILVATVVLLLLVVVLVPLLVNAKTFRPALETQFSAALVRKVTLGNLSFSLFSGSLIAGNISVADDPAFSAKPFLQAQSLRIGVEVAPLLFHRRLVVTSFVADSPSINLVHNKHGVWNFSNIGSTAASRTQNAQQESALPNFIVGQMQVKNGTAVVSGLPSTGPPFTYSKLNLSVQQFSFARAFPFMLSAGLPGGGLLEVKGNAGPVSEKGASETPFGANINVKHFDPVAAGVVQKSQGISMLADVMAQVTSDGQTLASNGTIQTAQLRLGADSPPSPSPVDITYGLNHNLDSRSGQINDLGIHIGAVAVHANGTYAMKHPQTTVALHLSVPNLPIDQVEALLPAFGVRLPSGSRLQGGTLTANLAIDGSATAPTISGPVQLDNTRLAGFGGTPIQTLRANVNASSQGTRIDNLYAAMPSLGTATGTGTIAPGGGLNFRLLATLNTTSGLAAQALSTAAADGIPIHITGTTSNPVIQTDLNRLLQNNAGNLPKQQLLGSNNHKPNAGDVLNKLFHH